MPVKSPVKLKGFGVNLPELLVEEVDILRGDVNRSRYIQRLIEDNLKINTIQAGAKALTTAQSVPSTKRKRIGDPSPNG